MPYPDNFSSHAFDLQFPDENTLTRDDVDHWFKGLMIRMEAPLRAFLDAVRDDYARHLGRDAPVLDLSAWAIADVIRDMIDNDIQWGEFDD